MRKILSVLLVSLLIFSFAACGSEKNISQGSGEESTETSAQESSGILIVYFSRWGNTDYPDDVDATTSASIVPDGDGRYGTTEYIANMIADEVGGDLHQIETVTPYTADFDELRNVNHGEMERNYLPELKESNLDIAGYEVVFVGYPVWATDVPQAVLSFLNEYDLSGKTVIPFCTHDGYGAGHSYQTIADASHAAVSLDGIAIEAKDVPGAQDTVSDWLADIGIYLEQLTDGADWLTGKRLNGSDSQDTVMEWVNGLGLDFGE